MSNNPSLRIATANCSSSTGKKSNNIYVNLSIFRAKIKSCKIYIKSIGYVYWALHDGIKGIY